MSSAPFAPWSGPRWVPWALHAALLGGMLAVLLLSLRVAPVIYAAEADEGTYLHYAQELATTGLGGYRALFEEYLGSSENWHYPPPIRAGFIVPTAGLVAMFGASFGVLTLLSLVSAVALVQVNFFFARRYFGMWPGLLIAALTGLSPLTLGLARRALQDSTVTFTMSLACWLLVECVVAEKPRRRAWLLFGGAFLVALLTKETALFLALPMVLFAAARARGERSGTKLAATAACLAGATLAALGIYWALGLSPLRLLELFRGTVASSSSVAYMRLYGAGPWFRYLVDYLLVSPAPVLLAAAFLGILVARGRGAVISPATQFFLLLTATLLFEYSFFTKNLRYLHLLAVPLSVFAALAIVECAALFSTAGKRRVFLALAASGVLFFELVSFDTLFLEGQVYDPITFHLLRARGILPAGN